MVNVHCLRKILAQYCGFQYFGLVLFIILYLVGFQPFQFFFQTTNTFSDGLLRWYDFLEISNVYQSLNKELYIIIFNHVNLTLCYINFNTWCFTASLFFHLKSYLSFRYTNLRPVLNYRIFALFTRVIDLIWSWLRYYLCISRAYLK